MARAKLKPIKQASRHKPTLANTFNIAFIKLPCCSKFIVSNENVEKVVNPPSKPAKIAKRISSVTVNLSSNKNDRNPISNEPKTFTSSVPKGKDEPNQFADCVCTTYLSIEPIAPPMATPTRINVYLLALSQIFEPLACHEWYQSMLYCDTSKW